MNMQKFPLICGFNLAIAAADVILLSRGILGFTGNLRIVIIAASALIFMLGNYVLLSMAFKKPVLKDKENAEPHDFEDAFKGWKGMNTPYNRQIDVALKQLEQLRVRKQKLKALSDDGTFDAAVEEVQSSMLRNFNRVINRLLIFDKSDIGDVNRNRAYIENALATNAQYLEVFRRFIDEISMLGDSSDDGKILSLQAITESLREIRTNGEASGFGD